MAAVFFVFGLLMVSRFWPAAFNVVVAAAGTIAALLVVYEVRLTKRLAQAEFIRDLQTSFSSDANIGEIWRKLLLEEEITGAHRGMVSSYLTFFETLHLLIDKGNLDMSLTEDLFRNRFFKAVGNQGILETALVKEAGSFANIHDLIVKWHDHLLAHDIPIHPGYYGYITAVTEAKGYRIVRLGESDLEDLTKLQAEVLQNLEDKSLLRENTDEMLLSCLSDHVTLGVRFDDALVAAAILYDAGDSDEMIKHRDRPKNLKDTVNLKSVLAVPAHRQKGLARTLVELLEQEAVEMGKSEVVCTIHPKNKASRSLFGLLGYRRVDSIPTSYGKRLVYARSLPPVDKRWAR